MLALEKLKKYSLKSPSMIIGPIGLSFSLENLHLVQLQKLADGSISLRAKASAKYPMDLDELQNSPKEIKRIVSQLIKLDHFYGNEVVSALPPGKCRLLPIAYQKNPDKQESQLIVNALTNRLDGDLNDYVIDYLLVRSSAENENCLALVATAKRESVIAYLENLRRASLNVTALEVNPAAIKRLVVSMSSEKHENVLVINFGQVKSFFTMISGDRLIFDHEVEFGEKDLLEKVANDLELSESEVSELIQRYGLLPDADQLSEEGELSGAEIANIMAEIVRPKFVEISEEINRALIYIASETRGGSANEIYMLGSIARWQGADQILRSLLHVEVITIPDILTRFPRQTSHNNREESSCSAEIAVATGLALRGLLHNE